MSDTQNKTMKLNKTEQKLVDKARNGYARPGQSCIESGLVESSTGNLRPYGTRALNALKSLVKKGVAEVVRQRTYIHSKCGHSTTTCATTYRLLEP